MSYPYNMKEKEPTAGYVNPYSIKEKEPTLVCSDQDMSYPYSTLVWSDQDISYNIKEKEPTLVCSDTGLLRSGYVIPIQH